MKISMFDEIPEQYAKALDKSDTLEKLRGVVAEYELVAGDAVDAVNAFTEQQFAEWRKALTKERRGGYMGEKLVDQFGPVLMPETMLKVSLVASAYKVPWALAYHRMVDTKQISFNGSRASAVI